MRGLQVDAVCRYGVGPVSFEARRGEFVVVTGGDRTGKSTVVGVVAGFDRPDAGRVLLDGDDVREMTRARLESRVCGLGAVMPGPGRAQRTIPPLIVADEPDAPFSAGWPNAFVAAARGLPRRLAPLLYTIRFLCDQCAVVVVGTHSRHLIHAADQEVTL